MIRELLLPGAALAVIGFACGLSAAPPGGVEVGQEVNYNFRETPVGAVGVSSLADLRGKPLMIEFWGTR